MKWPSFLLALLVLSACSFHHSTTTQEGRLGTAQSAQEFPPPPTWPDFPSDPIVPSEGLGYLEGSGHVTPTGEYVYELPLAVPPGRAGVQPALSLVYSSRGGNGRAGVGWSVSGLSEIRRCGKTMAVEGTVDGVDYDATDAFCLDGKKLVQIGNVETGVEYRTEHDTIAKIVSNNQNNPYSFRVWTKDGRIWDYEALQATRTKPKDTSPFTIVPQNPVKPVWLLKQVHDRSGNFMSFVYTIDEEADAPYAIEYRPHRIEYTYLDGAAGPAKRWVEFTYGLERPDPSFAYQNGVRFKTTTLLQSIDMYAPNPSTTEKVWSYSLTYERSKTTGRSLLRHVRRCDALSVCMWARSFDWEQANRPSFTAIDLPGEFAPDYMHWAVWKPSFVVFDADGDGRDDLLYRADADAQTDLKVFLRHAGQGSSPLAVRRHATPSGAALSAAVNLDLTRPVDSDGDGTVEMFAWQPLSGSPTMVGYQLFHWDAAQLAFQPTGPIFPTQGSNPPGLHLSDLNGDGRADLLFEPAAPSATWSLQINNGNGFGAGQDTGLPTPCASRARAFDINGDGRGDLLAPAPGCIQTSTIGLDDLGNIEATASNLDRDANDPSLILVDLNGDGLKDAFRAGYDLVRWNTGAGFGPWEDFTDGPAYGGKLDQDGGNRVADIDGDGREDIITFRRLQYEDPKLTVYLAREGGFLPVEIAHGPGDEHIMYGWVASQLGDFNGDGLVDIVQMVGDHIRVLQQEPGNVDVIVNVTDEDALDPREMVLYWNDWWRPRVDMPPPVACQYPQRCFRHGMQVVRHHYVRQPGAHSGYRERHYSYEDPRVDRRGRGFLGFGVVHEWDPDRPAETITTYDHQTNIDGIYPYAGLPSTVTHVVPIVSPTVPPGPRPSGTAAARVTMVETRHQIRRLHANRTYFTYPEQWTSVEWEEGGTILQAEERVALDSDRKVLRERMGTAVVDDYANILSEVSQTLGGVRETIERSYEYRVNDWLIALPATVQYSFGAAAGPQPEAQFTRFEHDSLGRLVTTIVEPDHPNTMRLRTTYTLDADGLPSVITQEGANAPTRTASIHFDSAERIFVDRVGNILGHYRYFLHHPAHGVVVLETDPNQVETLHWYDGFGRPRGSQRQGDAAVKISYQADDRDVPGHPDGVIVQVEESTGAEGAMYFDRIGRLVEKAHKGFNTQWIHERVWFDGLGRVGAAYRPGISAPATARTTYRYDSLDRIVEVVTPDSASTRYAHKPFRTEMWDPKNNYSTIDRDVDGRIVERMERVGVDDVKTSYSYGPFNRVETVTDDVGNVTTIEYDKLGRRTLLDDPDKGVTLFGYDGFGDLIVETDALGDTTYARDVLGRVTGKADNDGFTEFVWDQGTQALGKLSQSKSPDSTMVGHTYDTYGRPKETAWTIAGDTYKVTTFYDAMGRQEELHYPEVPGRDRFAVRYGYNAAGYLAQVEDIAWAGAEPRILWAVESRSVDDLVERSSVGTGAIATERMYDPVTGRLAFLQTLSGSAQLMLEYGYDANGNVERRVDVVASRIELFGYDALDRLKDWWLETGSAYRHTTFSYDTIGNLQKTRVNGVLQEFNEYGATGQPHAVTSTLQGTYGYDGRGRQTSGGGREIWYTNFDLPRTITKGTVVTTFDYDAHGRRVRKSGQDETTVYVGGLYERRQSGTDVSHVFYVRSEIGPVAQITLDGGTLEERFRYVQTDMLGSVGVVSDETGAEVERVFFEPFGRRTDVDGQPLSGGSSDVKVGFTGHRHDDELGLIDMNGRVYDPALKRFLTPDPFVSDPLSSQAYSRYSYVLNNPLTYIDPTGFQHRELQPLPPSPPSQPQPDRAGAGGPGMIGVKVPFDLNRDSIDKKPPKQETSDGDGHVPVTGPKGPATESPGTAPNGPGGSAPQAPGITDSNPIVQGIGGFVAGAAVGYVPFGSVVADLLIGKGVLSKGTPAARNGYAFGKIVGGMASLATAFASPGIGGGRPNGPAAVLVAVVSAVRVTGSLANVAGGVAELGKALATTGSGASGSGQPPSAATTPKGRPLSRHASEESLARHGFRKPYDQIDDIIDNPSRVVTQNDGASVYIQRAPGRGRSYNIAVVNEEGEVVTAMRNLSPHELRNLGANQGFNPNP